VAVIAAPWPALADTNDDLLADARAAFRRGLSSKNKLLQSRKDFSQASDAYLQLHERGIRNPALYRNLGNAALLADRFPVAIWAYQSGLQLDTNDRVMRDHLALARRKVMLPNGGQGRPDPDAWLAWLHRPTQMELSITLAVAYALAWLTGTIAVFARNGWLALMTLTLTLLAIAAAVALQYQSARADLERRTPLVVIVDNTPLYRGNGASYPHHPGVPTLPRGLEARRIHERGAWLQIRLSTGEIGWLPRNRVLVVEP
jgi:hypothetical protein